jgi:hypothetical protein
MTTHTLSGEQPDWVVGLSAQKRWQSHRTPKEERPAPEGGPYIFLLDNQAEEFFLAGAEEELSWLGEVEVCAGVVYAGFV